MTTSNPPPELLRALARRSEWDARADQEALAAGFDPEAEARVQAWLRARVASIPAMRRRRRRSALLASTGIAMAAAAAAGFLVLPASEPAEPDTKLAWQLRPARGAALTWFDEHGAAHRVQHAQAVSAPGRLETGDNASADLVTPGGVHVRMAPGTHLRSRKQAVSGAHKQLTLEQGDIEVRVPPLGRKRSFAIHTHDSQVIVHGTRFQVGLWSDAGQRRTCVRVQEGQVEVRVDGRSKHGQKGQEHEGQEVAMLFRGDALGCADQPRSGAMEPVAPASDSSDLAGAEQSAPAAHRRPFRPGQARRRGRVGGTTVRAEAPVEDASEDAPIGQLREQNRLLSIGLAAERNGKTAAAARAFRRLLAEHPNSPLAPDARAGLTRLAR